MGMVTSRIMWVWIEFHEFSMSYAQWESLLSLLIWCNTNIWDCRWDSGWEPFWQCVGYNEIVIILFMKLMSCSRCILRALIAPAFGQYPSKWHVWQLIQHFNVPDPLGSLINELDTETINNVMRFLLCWVNQAKDRLSSKNSQF